MITQNLTLFAVDNPPVQIINAVQGENNARTIVITVVDNSGAAINLTGKQAYLYVLKPDGNVVQETGAISGTVATFSLHTQAMTCPGKNRMFIEIVNSSASAILRVDGMVLNVMSCSADSAQPSETVLTAAELATIGAINATANANAAAENANSYVNSVNCNSIGAVPTSRKINNEPLSSDISLGTANLNDYEVGAFTPILTCATTNPTYTATSALGRYIKIGKMVYVNVYMVFSQITSAGSGQARIDGLPFECRGVPMGFAMIRSYNVLATENTASGMVAVSRSYISLMTGNGLTSNVFKTASGTGYLMYSGCYEIN